MKRKTKSILEELNTLYLHKDRDSHLVIESRAVNIIESAINLITLVHETYDDDIANDLERRLINSIKGQDSNKFKRGIKQITKGKSKPKSKSK